MHVTATAANADTRPVSAYIWGANMSLSPAPIDTPEGWNKMASLSLVKSMGVRLIRFPGGCTADMYNWNVTGSDPPTQAEMRFDSNWGRVIWKAMTIEEGLTYAEQIGADFLFQINMQHLDSSGKVTGNCYGLPLYPHFTHNTATPAENEAVLLNDALKILRKYANADPKKSPRRFAMVELGNEEAGWPEGTYHAMALRFAKKIREDKNIDPNLKIYLGAAQDWADFEPNQFSIKRDNTFWLSWEAATKKLLAEKCVRGGVKRPCIDGSGLHPYSDTGYDPFLSQYPWNIKGQLAHVPVASGPREMIRRHRMLTSTADVAVSEWNTNCGAIGAPQIALENASFERVDANNRPAHWTPWSSDSTSTQKIGWSYESTTEEAKDQSRSLKITLNSPSGQPYDVVTLSQAFDVDPDKAYTARAYFKTNKPSRVHMLFQSLVVKGQPNYSFFYPNRNEDCSKSPTPDACIEVRQRLSFNNITPNQWQGVSVHVGKDLSYSPLVPKSPNLPEGTTRVQLVLLVDNRSWGSDPEPTILYVDDVKVYDVSQHVLIDWMETAEHGLYTGETLLTYAADNVDVGIFHALTPNSGGNLCSPFAQVGANAATGLNTAGQAFAFTSLWAGGDRFDFDVQSEFLRTPYSPCANAMCLPGDVDVPLVTAYGGHQSDTNQLVFFLNNRSETQSAAVRVKVPTVDFSAYAEAKVTRLVASDYTDKTFLQASDSNVARGEFLEVCIPPRSMNRVELSGSP